MLSGVPAKLTFISVVLLLLLPPLLLSPQRDTIGLTSVQYVRCIKPNAAKLPGRMENAKVCYIRMHDWIMWNKVGVVCVADSLSA